LQASVGTSFASLGGQVDAIAPYSTTLAKYGTLIATLKSKLQTHHMY
jgi:hypothetical protein